MSRTDVDPRIPALRDHARDDVAVGHRADEPVALDDRRQPDVLVLHHLGGVGHGLVRVDRARIARHGLANARPHCVPPLVGCRRGYPVQRAETVACCDPVKPRRLAGRIRALALTLPEIYEDSPWGNPVFKVADNRMFASMSETDGGRPPHRQADRRGARDRDAAALRREGEVRRPLRLGDRAWCATTSRSRPRSSGCARATGSARPSTCATRSKPTTDPSRVGHVQRV